MSSCPIIAEIGINHNGDLDIAKKLIKLSKESGFDAVKFQKRDLDIVYTKEELDKPRKSPWGTTQREQKEGLEFSLEEYDEINNYCKSKNIDWFASSWDKESQKLMRKYKVNQHVDTLVYLSGPEALWGHCGLTYGVPKI